MFETRCVRRMNEIMAWELWNMEKGPRKRRRDRQLALLGKVTFKKVCGHV